MAYIGRDITSLSNAAILDAITFSDSAGPYNLTQSSSAFTPISAQALVISVDGVIQDPGSYTISAATITFDSTMSSSATNDFIVHNGVGLITTPSDDTITSAKIVDGAIVNADVNASAAIALSKLATDPSNASNLASGTVPTARLGSGTASSSTYLAGDQTYKSITAEDISWQSVTTGSTLTAVAGNGYPIDTTSNACTITLPASASVGDQMIFTSIH